MNVSYRISFTSGAGTRGGEIKKELDEGESEIFELRVSHKSSLASDIGDREIGFRNMPDGVQLERYPEGDTIEERVYKLSELGIDTVSPGSKEKVRFEVTNTDGERHDFIIQFETSERVVVNI